MFIGSYFLLLLTCLLLFSSLGSTRFFKVARAKSQEGLVVVKVFAIHDPTLPLATYRDRVKEINTKLGLGPAINCLPFQKAIVRNLFIFFK